MPLKRKKLIKKKRGKKVQDVEMYKYRIIEREVDALQQLANIEALLKQQKTPVEVIKKYEPPPPRPILSTPVSTPARPVNSYFSEENATRIANKIIPPLTPREIAQEKSAFKKMERLDKSVINQDTKKPVIVGGRRYNELIKDGYRVTGNKLFKSK
jgi:hypothetical protein